MNELVLAKRAADWGRLKALVVDSVSSPITRRVAEELLIEATLQQVDGNVLTAAKILRIDRSTLYAKIALHGILRRAREGEKPARRIPDTG